MCWYGGINFILGFLESKKYTWPWFLLISLYFCLHYCVTSPICNTKLLAQENISAETSIKQQEWDFKWMIPCTWYSKVRTKGVDFRALISFQPNCNSQYITSCCEVKSSLWDFPLLTCWREGLNLWIILTCVNSHLPWCLVRTKICS